MEDRLINRAILHRKNEEGQASVLPYSRCSHLRQTRFVYFVFVDLGEKQGIKYGTHYYRIFMDPFSFSYLIMNFTTTRTRSIFNKR